MVELLMIFAVMIILVSLLSPSLKRIIGKGVQNTCMNNEKTIGLATVVYQHDYAHFFPYGIPQAPGTFTYWSFTNSKPHQELLLDYLNEPRSDYICPADETPNNYWWWRFNDHPNYDKFAKGSSYMFSEQCILGVALWSGEYMSLNNTKSPSTLGYMSEGRTYPNGWNWSNADYLKVGTRIDWSHLDVNNFLYADGHVEEVFHFETATVRTDPLK